MTHLLSAILGLSLAADLNAYATVLARRSSEEKDDHVAHAACIKG